MIKSWLLASAKSLLIVVLGLGLGAAVAGFAGENPLNIMAIMIRGAFGTAYDFGVMLQYTTILTFAGLAVALPFQAGVFNIGAEGQILMGAMTCAVTATAFHDLPSVIALPLGLAAAAFGGAAWGAIAGWIRAYRGGHEVISSIMLNFIAAGLTGWLTINHLRATDSQNPETNVIAAAFSFEKWPLFQGAPFTNMALIAFVCVLGSWFFVRFGAWGYRIKAVKQSERAASVAGIRVALVRFWIFAAGGAAAGLAGAAMVMGDTGRFRLDMSDGFGFMGIPVALLGKGKPFGVLCAAFLFAALHHGSSALDLEATHVSRDLAEVIQALVVIVVVAERLFTMDFWRGLLKRGAA